MLPLSCAPVTPASKPPRLDGCQRIPWLAQPFTLGANLYFSLFLLFFSSLFFFFLFWGGEGTGWIGSHCVALDSEVDSNTCYVDQAGLTRRDLPASASLVLGAHLVPAPWCSILAGHSARWAKDWLTQSCLHDRSPVLERDPRVLSLSPISKHHIVFLCGRVIQKSHWEVS